MKHVLGRTAVAGTADFVASELERADVCSLDVRAQMPVSIGASGAIGAARLCPMATSSMATCSPAADALSSPKRNT